MFSISFEPIITDVVYSAFKYPIIFERHAFFRGRLTITINLFQNFLVSTLENDLQVNEIYTNLPEAFNSANPPTSKKRSAWSTRYHATGTTPSTTDSSL